MVKADQYITREMMRQALAAAAAAAARDAVAQKARLGDGECVMIRLDQYRNRPDRA